MLSGALATIYSAFIGTDRARSQLIANNNINMAVPQIKIDIQMAQNTDLVDGNPTPKNSTALTWTDYTLFTSANQTPPFQQLHLIRQ